MKTLVAVLLLVSAAWASGTAQADPDIEPGVTDVICGQLALGEAPGDIAAQLHEGDRRYSVADTTQTVLEATTECE